MGDRSEAIFSYIFIGLNQYIGVQVSKVNYLKLYYKKIYKVKLTSKIVKGKNNKDTYRSLSKNQEYERKY